LLHLLAAFLIVSTPEERAEQKDYRLDRDAGSLAAFRYLFAAGSAM
jgi:hypothetical protein